MKSGFVTIVGKPNAGKSTLLNSLLDKKIAITTPKAQTTRNAILGIMNGSDYQIVFVDTPGIHNPNTHLGTYMNKEAYNQAFGADIIYYLVDGNVGLRQDDKEILDKLFSYEIPALVVTRGLKVDDDIIEAAKKHGRVLISSERNTTRFINKISNYLDNRLAPRITIHGVLVDVYGIGILITGESGIGKSETALELIKRGHRLVTDDAVDIKEIDGELIGTSPRITIGMLEVRGIGIIDVTSLYGLSSVQESKDINLVIHFEHWKDNGDYDRLGINQDTQEILGVKVRKLKVPVRPGRNIAVIIEAAAVNYRHSLMSDISAVDIIERRMENLTSEDN